MINWIHAAAARVTEGPVVDLKEAGGWKGRISAREPGKLIEIACVVVPAVRIVIITAYEVWEFTRAASRPAGSPDTGDDAPDEEDRRT